MTRPAGLFSKIFESRCQNADRQLVAAVRFGRAAVRVSKPSFSSNKLRSLVAGLQCPAQLARRLAKCPRLRLTGPLLSAIFSGRITTWNDRELQQANPDLRLPNLPIKTLVRLDDSGTTAGFTDYLSKVDADWAAHMGSGLHVVWPKSSIAFRGGEGIVGAVKETVGSIGYVSANAVAKERLTYPLLLNRSKNYVSPTNEALIAAVKSSPAPRDSEKLSYVDMPGINAWPITDATYILVERSPKNPQRASGVLRFFYWSFLRGDAMASETGYVPLPTIVQARAVGSLSQVRGAQNSPLDFMGSNVSRQLATVRQKGFLTTSSAAN